jgi:hypothetical protein
VSFYFRHKLFAQPNKTIESEYAYIDKWRKNNFTYALLECEHLFESLTAYHLLTINVIYVRL